MAMRRMTLAANNKKSKLNKKKTFQVPEVLQEWFLQEYKEDNRGVIQKDEMYSEYLEFCEKEGLPKKEKQIFSKLIFATFPGAGSSRLGTHGSQVHHFFGITRRHGPCRRLTEKQSRKRKRMLKCNNKKKKLKKKIAQVRKQRKRMRMEIEEEQEEEEIVELEEEEEEGRDDEGSEERKVYSLRKNRTPSLKAMLQLAHENEKGKESESESPQAGSPVQQSWCKKEEEARFDSSSPSSRESSVSYRSRQTDETVVDLEQGVLKKDEWRLRLLNIHSHLLSIEESTKYRPIIERYLDPFVSRFVQEQLVPELDISAHPSNEELECLALCLCCAIFCGSLCLQEWELAKETFSLCANTARHLMAKGTRNKYFGIGLCYLAGGLSGSTCLFNETERNALVSTYMNLARDLNVC